MYYTSRSLLRTLAACSLAGLFSAAVPAGARAAGDAPLSAVLAASRTALGLDAATSIGTIVERGTAVLAGVKGTGEQWIDLRNGSYAQYINAGPASQDSGFEGTHSWTRDASGVVWDDGSADARYLNQDAAYLNRYALWAPERGGASVALKSPKAEGGTTYDVVSVTPPGGLAFEIWIDRATHLPTRVIQPVGTSTTTTTYSDYRRVAGLNVPFEQTFSSDGGTFSLDVTAADANPLGAAAHLVRPAASVHDFSIAPGTSTSVPFDLIDNHVYLDVKLNGKGPFRFIFDTGGDYLLDTGVAKALGIVAKGEMQAGGVGASTEGFSFAKVDRVSIGNATIRNQTFFVTPVRAGFGVGGGAPIDGLIGFGVLARFLTTFDYGQRRIILAMPGSKPPAAGNTLSFTFHGNTPMLDCTIGGFPGTCTVDTGSRVPLSVTEPFSSAHPSVVPANATAVGVDGFGVGGPAPGRFGRTTLGIGALTFPNIVTDFSTAKGGAFADPFTAGNIGGGIWKRFALTFDYPGRTMTLVANPGGTNVADDDVDRSGLFLIRTPDGVRVADARPGTPAALAGIQRGDLLVSIDGHDVAARSLASIRESFMAKAGTAYTLVVKAKDGTSKTVTLTLRDYV